MRRNKEEAQQTRARLLEATADVILRGGAAALTLDAVARETGISKGGLLHHFPSKDALLEALIAHLDHGFEQRLAAFMVGETEGAPGRWLRAYLQASFESTPRELALSAALTAALASDSRWLSAVHEDFEAIQRAAENDGLDPTRATVIRMAADGFWLTGMLGLAQPQGEMRARVLAMLMEMTYSA